MRKIEFTGQNQPTLPRPKLSLFHWKHATYPRLKPSHPPQLPPCQLTMNLGYININGFDCQAAWAVGSLLGSHNLDVLAIAETHFRHDVPKERFDFPNYSTWHSDRGGMAKVTVWFFLVLL